MMLDTGCGMTNSDRRLLRHLVLAVAVKLLLLTLLWWGFVRDARVPVDTDAAGLHLGRAPSLSQGETR